MVRGPQAIAATKIAKSSAGSVALAFSANVWIAPGASNQVGNAEDSQASRKSDIDHGGNSYSARRKPACHPSSLTALSVTTWLLGSAMLNEPCAPFSTASSAA